MKIIKNNIRYILALVVIFLVLLMNRNFFISKQVELGCKGWECKASLMDINLSDESPAVYFNDIFNLEKGNFYRAVFKYSSDKDVQISIKASTAIDEQQEIKLFFLKESVDEKYQEIIFKSDGSFTDLIFEKINSQDGANISISNVQATKLDVGKEEETRSLKPTLTGKTDLLVPDQKQTEDSSCSFDQLKENNIVFGQIFKPETDYITGVSLGLDAYAQSTNDKQKFILELRKADFDGEAAEMQKNPLAELEFSLKDLEKYRQENGKFRFPLFYPLSKDEYYFIGINNKKADASNSYYLILKGAKDNAKYPNGKMIVKKEKRTYLVSGSLYFVTYGPKFNESNGKKILSNTVIEDIGNGKGLFSYQPKGSMLDLIDLESRTLEVSFDDDKKIIYGSATEKNSSYMYKFETAYPFQKIKFQARQAASNWSKVRVSFSFDQKNWTDLPFLEKNTLQYFDWDFRPETSRDVIYFKISALDPQGEKKFGLAELKVQAELLMK